MRTLASILSCFLFAGAAQAQWRLGADIGVVDFGAVARDTVTNDRWVSLGSTLTGSARVERTLGRFRLAVGASTASMGLAVEDDSIVVAAKHAFRVVELGPELAFRLAATRAGAEFWLEAGPLLSVWLPEGSEGRVRGGGFGGIVVAVPLAGRVAGAFGVRATFSASPFDETEVASDFEPCSTARVGAQVGLRYRL